jgi:hypothetical protein
LFIARARRLSSKDHEGRNSSDTTAEKLSIACAFVWAIGWRLRRNPSRMLLPPALAYGLRSGKKVTVLEDLADDRSSVTVPFLIFFRIYQLNLIKMVTDNFEKR